MVVALLIPLELVNCCKKSYQDIIPNFPIIKLASMAIIKIQMPMQ